MSIVRIPLSWAAALSFVGLFAVPPLNASADISYAGRAVALFVTTPLTGPLTCSDTGNIPSAGGGASATLLSAGVPGVAQVDVLNGHTSGASRRADSTASVVDLVLLPGKAAELKASLVRAKSHAECGATSGDTEIVGLTFGGKTITVTGAPNQKVTIPGVATLVINEQTTTVSGHKRSISVNALHLTVPGLAEVIVSHAESGIECPPTGEGHGPCQDFMTGGGRIDVGATFAEFGFTAGKPGNNPGMSISMAYRDEAANIHVEAATISGYQALSRSSRRLTGKALLNGKAGYAFTIDVSDGGPSATDHFQIKLSNGYFASGVVVDGGIELHAPITLKLVTASPSRVEGGTDVTGRVVLTCPSLGGVTIKLSTSHPQLVSLPATVDVIPGRSTGMFTIRTSEVQSDTVVTITATYEDQSVHFDLVLLDHSILGVKVLPRIACNGMTVVGTVSMSTPAKSGGAKVVLSSSHPGIAPVPVSVTVAEGQRSAVFSIKTAAVNSTAVVTISAKFESDTKTTLLYVKQETVAGIVLDPKTIIGGFAASGKVVLTCPANVDTVVQLSSSHSAVASVPANVLVKAGHQTGTFSVSTVAVALDKKATISATLDGTTRTGTLTVTAPVLESLTLNPKELLGGLTCVGTLNLSSAAPPGGLVVQLSSSKPLLAKPPATVTVPAGKKTVTFNIPTNPVSRVTPVEITATLNSLVKTAILKLKS